MPARLLLFLCVIVPVFAKEAPDVDCLVVNLKYVSCTWNKNGTPEVNYTFYSRFSNQQLISCPHYLSENNMNIGCNQPCGSGDRFLTFHTEVHGNGIFIENHDLRQQVKLNPPNNLTVLNGSDSNLWFYWNHTSPAPLRCVESEVRFRTNNNNWEHSKVSSKTQNYSINLPSNSSRYELQVRNRIGYGCGASRFWSDWSEPVVWGSHDTTGSSDTMTVWTPVLYVVGAITLILLIMMLLHHERIRIILIPAVPKPSLFLQDIEDWFQFPKGLKESFKANYNEDACPVSEYNHVSQADGVKSDGSTSSVTTDQTDCSVSIDVNDPEDLSIPLSSFSSPVSSEEVQKVSN
ncbi:cytokine receptor common subunit gamma-like [Archocentrus centrarchus]|uniref:cytokine receptor common subunit gamma-like n=1 Tax=Archocentrus centrarchus TaxID=63155 RepID=UPI0011E9E307|nr:cytokine receptor common subunit gamma-like [Archocentrus centrarchus]